VQLPIGSIAARNGIHRAGSSPDPLYYLSVLGIQVERFKGSTQQPAILSMHEQQNRAAHYSQTINVASNYQLQNQFLYPIHHHKKTLIACENIEPSSLVPAIELPLHHNDQYLLYSGAIQYHRHTKVLHREGQRLKGPSPAK
jgi:hypothetical protein